jgi:tetratricopeptide (TPR) repeat protein
MLAGTNGAMDSFQQVLKLAFDAHNAGRQDEAEALCRVLQQINPANAQLLFLFGMILHRTDRHAEATYWLQRAAELEPADARIFSGLGCACRGQGDEAAAAKHFARAAELEPQNPNHFYNLGIARHRLGELEAANTAFQKTVALNPRDAACWNNLGKNFKQLNQLDAAIDAYDRALAISPGFEMARHGRAIILMTAGRLAEGFREYESRWSKILPRQLPQPRWHGEPIAEKTIFLHAEQGYGDALHFARFVPLVRARAGRVILECRPALKSLFVFSGCADEVIAYGEPIPPFDVFTSVISLPGILGITRETIPGQVPYLKAPPGDPLPPGRKGNLKVGIVWAGSSTHSDDASRSLPLELFAPILQTPGVSFYSLQLPVPERDRAWLNSRTGVVDLSPRLKDFMATAALVSQLDLIITVDTSVAHLAGALAKPVWTLVQFDPDWRWFLDRPDTPWYPTMRLFRQSQRHQWPPVVALVAEELRRRVAGRS